jgi:phenylacetate-CoA ligase
MTAPLPFTQRIYNMLMESQYWPPEQMLEFQRSQLSQLLRHAKATTPFYKTRLDCVFKNNGDIDWNRWNEIPILKREELRDNSEALTATTLPPGHGNITSHFTSGSTGIPVEVKHSEIFTAAATMAAFRFCDWIGIDWKKSIANISPIKTILNDEDHVVSKAGPDWLPNHQRGVRLEISKDASASRILELIKKFEVKYFSAPPGRIEALTEDNDILPDPVKLEKILCTGVQLLKPRRELFEKKFGAVSFDVYSTVEVGRIAAQCHEKSSYHINAEIMLVEILDDNNQPCSNGKAGRVILTPFFSTAQPLIRYQIGDIAEFGNLCECGRHLPTLKKLLGRENTLFVDPAGKKFRPIFEHEAIAIALKCKAHQIAQTGANTFEVRFVPNMKSTPGDITAARALVDMTLQFDATVIFSAVTEISTGRNSKLQIVMQEFDNSIS